MGNKLIIVESPAKVKTIKKFLGDSYTVAASAGHIRDLPKSKMGIDIDNGFEPEYITIRGKGTVVAELKKLAKEADKVYLATDPDREGEAISWHLRETLGLPEKTTKRISFNEITKSAVTAALASPRDIDMNLVDAQQARRVLDRIVGYSISPLLWRKVKKGLSAGRVQSATLGMICEREDEISAFIPEEYWNLDALIKADGSAKPVVFHLAEKERPSSKEGMDALLAELDGAVWKVNDIKTQPKTRRAPLPFTTSTLQQEASRYLNFAPSKTMRIAQQLYEGVSLGKSTTALITYLRTDSTRVAAEAHAAACSYIGETFGKEYVAPFVADGKNKANVQDAHEAIRPTDVTRTPDSVKEYLERDQFRLYQLIWKRFVASRMSEQKSDVTTVKAVAGGHNFAASSTKVTFKGFRLIYDVGDDEVQKDGPLDKITLDSVLVLQELKPEQHFTQPPAHYTEATLVHAMEECGIGRPSTYAPTIALLMSRGYINKEGKNIFVTDLGEAVNNIMQDSFKKIADTGFTAEMEGKLDRIAEGGESWRAVVGQFYPEFKETLDTADEKIGRVKIPDPVSDVICDKCGRNMVIKMGKYGKFLACPGFPECRNIKTYLEKAGVKCPKCGGELIIRKTKKGRKYYGCESYPNCDYMSWNKPSKK
ncbi:MAG: type I DNA topoisomerase [Lachnospiraceae bacterium]|nr:type I DNA topoisomerase [Candidatus Minthocola equi]